MQVDNAATSLTFSGGVGGSGGLVKSGPGVLVLSGGNVNYNGSTAVNNGQLILFDAGNFQSPMTINPARN